MTSFTFQNKIINNVLIVGYGITGKSIKNFLSQYNLNIEISESIEDFSIRDLNKYDLFAVSPGIPLNKNPYSILKKYKQKIISDIDIFSLFNSSKKIAITGSNGKSTVVSILGYILEKLGKNVATIGNIGKPVLSCVNDNLEYSILELSSFQIDLLNKSNFDIGCVINITPDHLDRYDNFNEYANSKLSLKSYCNDFFIYDYNNNGLKYENNDFDIINKDIFYNEDKLLSINDTNLSGKHNLENIVIVLNIIKKLDIDLKLACNIIKDFIGLNYRCTNLGFINNVQYINDSKGTNIGATIKAIESLAESKNIILILGGVAKGGDFSTMQHFIDKYVKNICIFGKDKNQIDSQINNSISKQIFDNLEQCFYFSKEIAKDNDIILFSPACASFDQYKSYSERGKFFTELFIKNKD